MPLLLLLMVVVMVNEEIKFRGPTGTEIEFPGPIKSSRGGTLLSGRKVVLQERQFVHSTSVVL